MAFKFVNLWQTPDERKEKYWLAISLGCNPAWARSMRDWRLSKIERRFNLCFPEHHNNAPVFSPYAQFLLPSFSLLYGKVNPPENDPLSLNSRGIGV